jgi:carbon monoxide dehydrogenase subunit G
MSTVKHESEIKLVPYPQEVVYAKLSDLNNVAILKQIADNPMAVAGLKSQANLSDDQVASIVKAVNEMTCDTDYVTFHANMLGDIRVEIVDRDEPKCVKMSTGQHPLPVTIWIQLLPHGEGQCRMRVTAHAEVNFFMKKMVEKPLKKGVDGIADMLSKIPYSM